MEAVKDASHLYEVERRAERDFVPLADKPWAPSR
jgi:hypothetical protein